MLAEADTWSRYAGLLQDAKPAATVHHHRLESWASLRQALLDRTSTDDLFAIVSQRGAPPDLARTAIGLAERFPDASIALIQGAHKPARTTPEPMAKAAIAEAASAE